MATEQSPFDDFPSELVQLIFSFLNNKDLCAVALVCKTWHELANNDTIWRRLCLNRWASKPGAHLGNEVFFRANFKHPRTLASLSVSELKMILKKRNLHTIYFEKSDLQQAVAKSTPPESVAANIPSKWKASYATAEKDSKRSEITFEELTRAKWIVYFRRQQGRGYEMAMTACFYPDYTYHSDDGNTFTWQFFGSSNHVQVGQFPAIKPVRSEKDWSWRLENDFALLIPIDCDPSNAPS